jgi:hypothetical protein
VSLAMRMDGRYELLKVGFVMGMLDVWGCWDLMLGVYVYRVKFWR